MKKVFKIIAFSTLAICGIAYVLCYIFLKEQTTYFTECLIDFINRPLPIIGVSLLVVLAFVYKCVISTRYGKKALNEFKQENDKLRQEVDEYKELVKQDLISLEIALKHEKEQNDELFEYFIELCELSHNVKVQALAKKLRGVEYEETTDSDTKAKEI